MNAREAPGAGHRRQHREAEKAEQHHEAQRRHLARAGNGVDGESQTVLVRGLSVQLVHEGQPTISLTLSRAQADGHPFVVGAQIAVTFGGPA